MEKAVQRQIRAVRPWAGRSVPLSRANRIPQAAWSGSPGRTRPAPASLRNCKTSPNGFTLIEILIATAIFATVLVAMNTVFYSALRLQKTTTSAIEKSVPRNHALAVLRSDLRSIIPPGGMLAGTNLMGGRQSSLEGSRQRNSMNDLVFLQIHTTTGVTDDALLLDSSQAGFYAEPLPWPEVQRVTYYLRDPDPAYTTNLLGRELVRTATRNLFASVEEYPLEEPLLEGVETLEFFFYDGALWKDSWNGTNEVVSVPEAIRVHIVFASPYRDARLTQPPIDLVVPVVTQARTNVVSAAETEAGEGSGQTNEGGPNQNQNNPGGGNQNAGAPPPGGGPSGGGGGGGGQRPPGGGR